jgi:hypothetical protein
LLRKKGEYFFTLGRPKTGDGNRLRRRAHADGIRPLCTPRDTWATLALRAGKSVRWVADDDL